VIRPSPLFVRELRDAIRAGRKTQTRRVCKPFELNASGLWLQNGTAFLRTVPQMSDSELLASYAKRCAPHGKPGDIWYLREPLRRVANRLDGACCVYEDGEPCLSVESWRWKLPALTSMSMPAIAARTLRYLESVRAERLHDISEADAQAEGVAARRDIADWSYRFGFADLWDSINHDRGYSWASNPWVFVYTFRHATKDEVSAAWARQLQTSKG
jgi:hypothetical protein